MKEWARVLRNGGILSIVLPTEGGLWWNIGRCLTTRRSYGKLGFDYDYRRVSTHLNLLFVTNIAIEKS